MGDGDRLAWPTRALSSKQPHTQARWRGGGALTLLSPSGARGSVIQDPNLEPEVLTVTGSLMPVSFPQAGRHSAEG